MVDVCTRRSRQLVRIGCFSYVAFEYYHDGPLRMWGEWGVVSADLAKDCPMPGSTGSPGVGTKSTQSHPAPWQGTRCPMNAHTTHCRVLHFATDAPRPNKRNTHHLLVMLTPSDSTTHDAPSYPMSHRCSESAPVNQTTERTDCYPQAYLF